MTEIKNLIQKIKYEACIFTALSMNFLIFFTKDDLMSDIIYPMHLVDLKIGFISRTLAGTISGILWEHPTEENIIFLHSSVVVLTFLLTSVFLGRCIKKADKKSGRGLFTVSLAVAVFPYGFMTFINLFELLDIYWVLSVVLCLLSGENKYTAFLIPVFIITGSWAHYSFFLAFMPVIYIMCFTKCLKEKTRLSYILTAVIVAISVPVVLYFFLTCRSINTMSFSDFTDYILEKAGSNITSMEKYVGASFRPYNEMNRIYGITELSEDSPTALKALIGNFKFALIDSTPLSIICDLILAIPPVSFFLIIWKRAIGSVQDKKEKFLYFLCLITPLVQLAACFTSSDTSRWLSLMMISELFMLAVSVKEGSAPVTDALNAVTDKLTEYKAFFIPVLLIYINIIFVW